MKLLNYDSDSAKRLQRLQNHSFGDFRAFEAVVRMLSGKVKVQVRLAFLCDLFVQRLRRIALYRQGICTCSGRDSRVKRAVVSSSKPADTFWPKLTFIAALA